MDSRKLRIVLGSVVLGCAAIAIYTGCTNGNRETAEREAMIKSNAMAAEEAEMGLAAEREEIKSRFKNGRKSARRPAAARRSLYVVQIGAFRIKENAVRMHEQLKSAGYPVVIREFTHSKNGSLHFVRIEPTPNKNEALEMVKTLQNKEHLSAAIVVVPDAG